MNQFQVCKSVGQKIVWLHIRVKKIYLRDTVNIDDIYYMLFHSKKSSIEKK